VQRVTAVNNAEYGISRFESTKTLFANDTAVGSDEAGFYVGDSPNAASVMRDNVARGNALGFFIRHARGVTVVNNRATGNCQGILVLDDGEPGGVGNAVIQGNSVFRNNMFCPPNEEAPPLQGGILLLGATQTRVVGNSLKGNVGTQLNSGGIVVLSAAPFQGSDPQFDTISRNTAFRDKPADLRWDGSGNNVNFVANHCAKSIPAGLCH
jgi:Right handed beta helix region